NKAIEMVANELNIRINEFTVSGIPYGTMFAHKWYVGTDDNCDPSHVRQLIDDKLKILNDDYRVERGSALQEIFVEIVSPQVFLQWMEANNKVGAQNKFPRVMKNHQFSEWEQFVKKTQTTR
ncbi:MAG: GH3 auxin-responsive promoter family protein, partial [Bacteroidota bacterium]